MIISLNPSYKCSFRCNFCYLSKTQLSDPLKIEISDLKETLKEITKHYKIEHLDLYGGEIGILPLTYLVRLNSILIKYVEKVNVITNLFQVNPYFTFQNVNLSVSYDSIYRQFSDVVFDNMCKVNKDLSILTLATPSLMKMDIAKFIEKLNTCKNVKSLEIKKYSTNQYNSLSIENYHLEYESFIQKFLDLENLMNFKFINKELIKNSINKKYSSFSDNHLYITPKNELSVLDFDDNNKEYFRILKNIDEYKIWSTNEKIRVDKNKFCFGCDYKGNCLTEHIRLPLQDPELYSCDGSFKLLKKYA